MCIFTGEVERVVGTHIVARMEREWQYLAYEMELASDSPIAMVLPLPVTSDAAALEFISLEHYPALFNDLEEAFRTNDDGFGPLAMLGSGTDTLPVERVGAFEASFVPRIDDFSRLAPRFRLPADVWSALPRYADYGFAVFKLDAGEQHVHAMALRFRSRESGSLFFPTVHVHTRRVEPWAHFDHFLYAQGAIARNRDWQISPDKLGTTLRADTAGIIQPSARGYRRRLFGVYENRDTRLALDVESGRT